MILKDYSALLPWFTVVAGELVLIAARPNLRKYFGVILVTDVLLNPGGKVTMV